MGLPVTPPGNRGRQLSKLARAFFALMPSVYRMVDGIGLGDTLVLSTMGVKTQRRRDVHLKAFAEVERFSWLVVGSRWGDSRHPDWFLNLARYPDEVWVQIGARQMQVRVAILQGVEYKAAWARIVSEQSQYARYAQMTDRQIPIVRLSPVEMVTQTQLVLSSN